jgi:hypothetical protein
MESHVNASEDFLIDGLSFKIGPSASYITQRRSVTFFPQGGNQYSPTGVKVIKIALTGDQWMDPSTFRIMFDLTNLDATAGHNLRTFTGPWSFFRRLRILAGGQVLEDIDYYNRAHELFSFFQTRNNRQNQSIEGFGKYLNFIQTNGGDPYMNAFSFGALNLGGILPGESRTVLFKPLAGIFNQTKYLPLRYCQIQIELELVNDIFDPIVYTSLTTGTPPSDIGPSNCSKLWQIQQVQAKCYLCTLDNSLENEYAKHLLEGKALPIQYDTYVQQFQTLAGKDFSTNISRSFTRLKSVFVSMNGALPGCVDRTVEASPLYSYTVKGWNTFYNPIAHDPIHRSAANDVEFQLQIGSKLYPEYPIRSQEEAFYQTMKTMGLSSTSWHAVDINVEEWSSCKFLYGIDTEKVTEVGFTGLNTKAGDLILIKLKQAGVPTANLCTGMYVLLHADQILNIRDTGCEVFD